MAGMFKAQKGKSRADYNMYAADMQGDGKKAMPYREWSGMMPSKKQKEKLSDVVAPDNGA